jgi:MraZ protein
VPPHGVQVVTGGFFQSQALNAVDAKGRVSVPALFRSTIEERCRAAGLPPESNTLMIGEHKNGVCLAAYDQVGSAEMYRRMEESVADLPSAERFDALEAAHGDTFGHLEPIKFEGTGRMQLSPILRKLAGIGDLAYFIGVGSSFQIWSPARALASFEAGSRNHNRLSMMLEERGVAL